MKILKVRPFIMGTMLLAGAALSGCYHNSDERLKEYLIGKDVTRKEFDSIVNSTQRDSYQKTLAASQYFLDSMAYRDLFNQTMLAQDSAAVTAFNSIQRIKVEDLAVPSGKKTKTIVKNAFEKDLIERNNKISVINGLIKNFPVIPPFRVREDNNNGYLSSADLAQHYTDTYYYGEFFKEQGLMADSTFKDNFEKVTKEIKPD